MAGWLVASLTMTANYVHVDGHGRNGMNQHLEAEEGEEQRER